MGQRLIALASVDSEFQLVGAIDSPQNPRLGQDAGTIAGVGEIGLPLSSTLPADVDVIIDFSAPAGAESVMAGLKGRTVPLVMATTGLHGPTKDALVQYSKVASVVWSPNMSLAVNLGMKLVETTARALKGHPSGADVEIIERHHRYKEDSPSGTALKFGEIVAKEMGLTHHQHGREGMVGKRPHNEIGYHAVRTGDNPGEHTIVFGLLGETIEVRVAASNRDCYAHGALLAAKFAAKQKPGLYSMYDVLGLS